MTIVYDKLDGAAIEPVVQVYEAKDCMLYALGVGLGHDPTNEDELAFVYEKNLESVADHGHGHRAQHGAGAQSEYRHRLADGGQRRARLHAPASAERPGRGDRTARGLSK